ncbi:cation:proton antiporter [Streptomyces sp. NPDC002773]|uniref:cation:proton antiporter n=1 Tax=Streptomyces sp. NPDC002773 TaxID=3154430 RepID=UPI00332A3C97
MSLETAEVAHVLLALSVLLVAAHLGGYLFARMRQPQVIGEILGGLLLGPTVLGELAPDAQRWLLPTDGATGHVLGAFYQIGLLLLVYLTGTELRARRHNKGQRTIGFVTVSGLVLPFGFGLAIASAADTDELIGPNGSPTTLALIFGMAVAVTSVPVISRIMMDLGILQSLFARIVLAVAVIEDVLLYVILAIVLGVAQADDGDGFGLWALLAVDSLPLAVVYFTAVPLIFLGLLLWLGPRSFSGLTRSRINVLEQRSPLAFRLVVVFLLCAACTGLGIDPIFGALVAGMCTAGATGDKVVASQETLRHVSMGLFVPIYFAIVGVKLDLVRHFDPLFFLWFFVLACLVKSFSVWLGARAAGESHPAATNLAVAMNARGGPGIVLASVAFGAHVINESFFTSLVLLSIISSQMAGYWLGRIVAHGKPLMPPAPGQPVDEHEHEPHESPHATARSTSQ